MVSEPQEWGGWFCTLILTFLTPLVIILPQMMCTENQCRFGYLEIPTDLTSYISALTLYLGFFLFVNIASVVPIGREVDGPQSRIGRLQYRINGNFLYAFACLIIFSRIIINFFFPGFLCAILSLILFVACVYKEFELADLVVENYVQLSISGWILGVILSLLLFVKGNKAPVANLNIHGSTDSRIYNFWQGREINPRVGPVDVKINLFRTAMIAIVIFFHL